MLSSITYDVFADGYGSFGIIKVYCVADIFDDGLATRHSIDNGLNYASYS